MSIWAARSSAVASSSRMLEKVKLRPGREDSFSRHSTVASMSGNTRTLRPWRTESFGPSCVLPPVATQTYCGQNPEPMRAVFSDSTRQTMASGR